MEGVPPAERVLPAKLRHLEINQSEPCVGRVGRVCLAQDLYNLPPFTGGSVYTLDPRATPSDIEQISPGRGGEVLFPRRFLCPRGVGRLLIQSKPNRLLMAQHLCARIV